MVKRVADLLVEVLAQAGVWQRLACLAQDSPALKDPAASLLARLADIRRAAAEIAVAVGMEAQKNGVAPKMDEQELRQRVLKTQWAPAYANFPE